MLYLDHITVAVRNLQDTVNNIQKATGIVFSDPVIPFPGTIGQVAYLGTGFIELISLVDANVARTSPLGAAFASYAEQREGIFGVAWEVTGGMQAFVDEASSRDVAYIGPTIQQAPLKEGSYIEFKTAFLGFHMPWLIEYERSRTWPSPYHLTGVEFNTKDMERDVSAYIAAYNLDAPELASGHERVFKLERGWLSLHETANPAQVGFHTIVIEKEDAAYRLHCTNDGIQIH
ncbi:hypothetical protein E0485_05980 [Paenibacillus albiflavus]|uniref:Glyoxalase-like domain-containing protein n=1 Tax=Paenibacillus albiflavus TaxID=2545760 RepID=A0A4R4EM54_9BACL|nr:VOC family protein [Paenibacillus albiflavus]TCZ79408.1 hypothetical protein E0485_05980 [Paenibacillus albiflavus]